MARTISEIQQQIITAKEEQPVLAGISSDSKVAIWRLWTYVVAVCMWTLENLFDAHKAEVTAAIAIQKPHTLQWYVEMAKKFQLDDELPYGSDVYNPIDDSPETRIITHAAATEMPNLLRLKVAKGTTGSLAPLLEDEELVPFKEYMHRIKDAGVRLMITSDEPDVLTLAVTVYYDPLVLDHLGRRIGNPSVTPVVDAINLYLTNLPFNGLFVVNRLIDAMENAIGVHIAMVNEVDINTVTEAELSDGDVDPAVKYIPLAGYMEFNIADSVITYIPFEG